MLQDNYTFLEEYKSLEKLCNEIYDAKNGVTCYINEMNERYDSIAASIPGWKDDYYTLKRLRHIRNQLTHEVGTLETEMCTPNDIEYLVTFKQRILSRTDPLAQLILAKKRASPPIDEEPDWPSRPYTPPPRQPDSFWLAFLPLLAVLGVMFLIFFFSTQK